MASNLLGRKRSRYTIDPSIDEKYLDAGSWYILAPVKFQIRFEFANDERFIVTSVVFLIILAEISTWLIIKRRAFVAQKQTLRLNLYRDQRTVDWKNNVISLTHVKKQFRDVVRSIY